jgi:hypothetical protein
MATFMTSFCILVSIRPRRTHVYTYAHTIDNYVMLLTVFVDDILLASRFEAVLATVKADFQSRFTMTDEGLASEFLGVRIFFQGTWNSHTGPAALLRDYRPRLRQLHRTAELLGSAHAGECGALCAIRTNSGTGRMDSAFSIHTPL